MGSSQVCFIRLQILVTVCLPGALLHPMFPRHSGCASTMLWNFSWLQHFRKRCAFWKWNIIKVIFSYFIFKNVKFKNACKAANNGFSNMYVHLVCFQGAEGSTPIAWLGELSTAYLGMFTMCSGNCFWRLKSRWIVACILIRMEHLDLIPLGTWLYKHIYHQLGCFWLLEIHNGS